MRLLGFETVQLRSRTPISVIWPAWLLGRDLGLVLRRDSGRRLKIRIEKATQRLWSKVFDRERIFEIAISMHCRHDAVGISDVADARICSEVSVFEDLRRFALSKSTLLIWELIYFLQFFGLEFFFRGFLLHSLKPSIGIYSIFVMMVPYCMIHWGKPIPETFAAIFAGIFLGWLSYRNGNIWMGLVLHCTVAFSMDVMSLFNKGLLF